MRWYIRLADTDVSWAQNPKEFYNAPVWLHCYLQADRTSSTSCLLHDSIQNLSHCWEIELRNVTMQAYIQPRCQEVDSSLNAWHESQWMTFELPKKWPIIWIIQIVLTNITSYIWSQSCIQFHVMSKNYESYLICERSDSILGINETSEELRILPCMWPLCIG